MCRQMVILQGFCVVVPFFFWGGGSRKLPPEVTQDTPSMRGWNMLQRLEPLNETNLHSRVQQKKLGPSQLPALLKCVSQGLLHQTRHPCIFGKKKVAIIHFDHTMI